MMMNKNRFRVFALSVVLCLCQENVEAFTPASFGRSLGIAGVGSGSDDKMSIGVSRRGKTEVRMVGGGSFFRPIRQSNDGENEDEEEDLEEEDEVEDPYKEAASSEFTDSDSSSSSLALTTTVDWGGAYGKLRQRFEDIESGKNGPSKALFRIMSKETPNEAISNFVKEANPEVVVAMSGAISSLLGGLSNPVMGLETIVRANREKLGNLCFQLQMTGYMFRNAEYVLALKDLMNINSSNTSISDYKKAFDRIDKDNSGYIEVGEIRSLLADVYDNEIPSFEVDTFLNFFDANNDGRISWDEFEKGLGNLSVKQAATNMKNSMRMQGLIPEDDYHEDDDDDDYIMDISPLSEPTVSGMIQVEMKNGKIIQVEAKEYIRELKKEAEALKEAIRMESGMADSSSTKNGMMPPAAAANNDDSDTKQPGGIAGYIASLEGDLQSLTRGISPEVVDAMKLLIDFVLDGRKIKSNQDDPNSKDFELEVPGTALQQLALWQIVLGYKLREEEATGDYRKLLED